MARDFGILKGSDLVQVLGTLLHEGLLETQQIQVLRAVNQELGSHSELYFQTNHCVHASSSDYAYRLDKLLYKKRLLERAEVEELEKAQRQAPDQSLAQLMLAQGSVSETELAQVIAHLTEIVAYEVLLWKDTAFSLDTASEPLAGLLGTGLPAPKLMPVKYFVEDADKNLPVLVLMREQLGNLNMILRRQQELEREQLSDYQYHVYRFVNNRHSVRELLLLSELGYFETFAALYQLLSWQHIALGQLEVPRYTRKAASAPAPQTAAAKPASAKSPATPPAAASRSGSLEIEKIETQAPGQRQLLRRGRGSELFQVLVAILKSGYQSGRVVIDNQRQIVRAELSLHQSCLVHASTSGPNVRFGEMLVKKGLVGPGQLREALEDQKSHPEVHLGEILVRHGLLAAEQIPELVYHQMECVLYDVLSWSDAKFYFIPNPQQEVLQKDILVPADFDVQDGRLIRKSSENSDERNLLHEADKNLPILLMIREKIPDHQLVLMATAEISASLSDEQAYVLGQINGRHSIQDLLIISKLPYFQTLTALFQLLSLGALQAASAGAATGRVAPTTRPRPVVAPVLKTKPMVVPVAAESSQPESEPLTESPDLPDVAFISQLESMLGRDTLEMLRQVPEAAYVDFRQALQAMLRLIKASQDES